MGGDWKFRFFVVLSMLWRPAARTASLHRSDYRSMSIFSLVRRFLSSIRKTNSIRRYITSTSSLLRKVRRPRSQLAGFCFWSPEAPGKLRLCDKRKQKGHSTLSGVECKYLSVWRVVFARALYFGRQRTTGFRAAVTSSTFVVRVMWGALRTVSGSDSTSLAIAIIASTN